MPACQASLTLHRSFLTTHPPVPHPAFCHIQREVSALEEASTSAAESPEVTALNATISQKQQQLDKLESRLNGIKDRLFADFR